jgi:tetratricopeptide (TPR) repeat protein
MTQPPSPDNTRTRRIICVALVAVTLLVFGRTLRHEFVNYDDDQYFYTNPHVQSGLTWRGVVWAFRANYAGNWFPLTWLSIMLDTTLFGAGPRGPHLTNIVLHAGNTVLLFLLFQQLSGAQWRSAFVAGLFALHPLHVESVAWATERKDVLSTFFGFLALLFYTRYARATGRRDYWLSVTCFGLSLMSKPMLVTLPFVMLLLDWWPLRRLKPTGNLRFVLEKAPFFLLSIASSAITLAVQSQAIQPLGRLPVGIRLVNAIVVSMAYLWKMLWPFKLAIPYPHPGYWPLWLFCLSAAALLLVSLAAVRFRARFPFLATGWLWYLGMLVPVIGLVQVGMQSMADRYTYLPLIGVFIMLTWGGAEILARWRTPVPAIGVVAALVLGACAVRTVDQLRIWQNSETLFLHALRVTKGNDIAHYNLAAHYLDKLRLEQAIEHFRRAIQIRPNYDDALNNLGVALAMKGELTEAARHVREAIRCRPNKPDAHYNLGNILVMQRDWDGAIAAYAEALRLKPDYPEAHNNLANVLATQGRADEAIQHYREVLRLNPRHEAAQRQLRILEPASPQSGP